MYLPIRGMNGLLTFWYNYTKKTEGSSYIKRHKNLKWTNKNLDKSF